MNKKNIWNVVSVFLLGFLVVTASAQSNEGSLAGTVTDPNSSVIPHATVTLSNTSNGQVLKTTTGGSGDYRFSALTIGTYNVKVEASGFKVAQQNGVVVQIDSTSTLNVSLAVGSTTETIEVNAEAPQLQTDSSDVGTVVSPQQVVDLPLSTNGSAIRNSQDFVFLTPATYGTGTGGGTFEGGVSGGQAFGSEILFDGASLQVESFGDGFANEILPSVEATGEFKVLVAGIPAQYGRTTGGIQTYSSKSGSNSFHGSAFELFRNNDLDANTWFNNYDRAVNGPSSGNAVPNDKKNNYGVVLGGPVRIPFLYNGKDKTFFFFSWEQFRQNSGYSQYLTLPTPANLMGDYSASLVTTNPLGINPCDGSTIYQGQIFDPTTARTVGGVQCRTAYEGNVIPNYETTASAVAQSILKYLPTTTSSLSNNYLFAGSYPIVSTTESMRFDQEIGAADKMFVSYNVRDNVRNNNVGGELQLPVTPFLTSQDLPTHLIRIGEDHIFSPNVLNHAVIAFTRVLNKEGFVTPGQGKDYSQLVGLPGGTGDFFPGFQLSSVALGDIVSPNNNGYNSKISDNSYYAADSISWTKGRHNFTIGGDWRYNFSISSFISVDSGTFNIGTEQTAGDSNSLPSSQSGNSFASFELGQIGSAVVKQNFVTVRNTGQYSSIYLQDEFKIRKDLNLSLGIRYDVDLPYKELHNYGSQFSPTEINTGTNGTGTPGALVFAGTGAGRDGLSSRWSNVDYKNVEPRLGFAYHPDWLNNKVVFSGTYDIINAPILQWQQIYSGVPAGYSAISQVNDVANPFAPAELLDPSSPVSPIVVNSGTYGVPAIPTAQSFDRSQLNGQQVNYTKRDFGRPGFEQTWSFGVQQQLATDLILSLQYLGERGVHLGSNQLSLDNLPISAFALGTKLNDTFSASTTTLDGVNSPYPGFTGTVAQALRPYPQYTSINTGAYGENHGQLSYNALTAKLERHFHNGVNLLASYTWSKMITDTGNIIGGSLGGAYTSNIQNPQNIRAEKAISPEDTPQIVVLSYLYELPFGKGKMFLNQNRVADFVVGGWSISGIQRYQSGQPIGFSCATGIPGWGNCIRWNLVQGQQIQSAARRSGHFNPVVPGSAQWYAPRLASNFAFADPNANVSATVPYTFGDKPSYQGNDRNFGYIEEDFGVIKRFPITKQVKLQVRVEAFNAFNRHIFGGPDTNPYDGLGNPGATFNSGGGGFGTVSGTQNSPRALQLTMRVEF
jgi:hypothetical protein